MILVVVPSASDGASPVGILAGLPLITRLVRAARAAGFEQVFVCDMGPPVRRLVEDAGGVLLSASISLAPISKQRIVVVPGNVVPQARWLHVLLTMPVEPERLYVDGACAVVVETERPGVVLAAAARSTRSSLMVELTRAFDKPPQPLALDGRFPLESAADVATAETFLMRSLIKHNEGFMSRHFERRISLALSRRLAPTSVTPDMMTLTSVAIGLAGASFFLSSAPAWQLTGALLFLAHSVLDGCDGELARLKFQQSRRGAMLDFWGDNAVHVAVFACMAVGWTLSAGTGWPLVLGAAAVLATLGSAALLFEPTAEDRAVSADSPRTTRVAAKLANRDFIYLVIVLSVFGKASWFLVAAAVGAPTFLLALLWDRQRHGRVR
jgi:phosphatidylglycerophosphate synthase